MKKWTHGIVPHNIIKNPTCYHSSLGVTTSRYCVLIIGSDYLYDHAPCWRTLSRTTDFNPLGPHPSLEDFVTYNGLRPSGSTPLVGGLCHVQRTLHSSLGVTTSRYCVLIIGSDYLYDHAPHRRTLSGTTDFNPLGPRPSSEDFVTYNRLRPSGSTPLVEDFVTYNGLCTHHWE